MNVQLTLNQGNKIMDQATARALCEAGYMTVKEYLELCKKNGWKAEQK